MTFTVVYEVMTLAKITAGTGYVYLTRHTALGDAEPSGERDAAAYYTAQGNPPGRWTGRGAPLLGLAGREVTEEQMRALFGIGAHPDVLRRFRKLMQWRDSARPVTVTVRYVTRRGPWFGISW